MFDLNIATARYKMMAHKAYYLLKLTDLLITPNFHHKDKNWYELGQVFLKIINLSGMFKRLSRSKCVSLSYLIYLKTVHSNRNWFDFTLFSQTFYANAIFYLHIPIVASLNLSKTVLYFSRTLLFVLLLLLKCQSTSHL